MRLKTIALLSAATVMLAACGQKTETAATDTNVTASSQVTNTTVAVVSEGQTFANAAASSDAFEIAASQLALTASTSAKIKAFAKHMIDGHTESTAKLKAAAAKTSPAIAPDPTLSPAQQNKLDALKTLKGADFDRAYATAQVDAHEPTLATLKDYSTNGATPELKAFATELVPIVTAHLNMAKGLKP
jgi:putative membrane protein